jgi:hypothetical protein
MALKNLIEDGVVEVVKGDTADACNALDHEMYRLFDNWEEEVAEKRVIRILQGSL